MHPKSYQKLAGINQNLDIMRGRSGGALAPMQEVLLLNEPVSQYRFMNLHKTGDNDSTYQNDANTCFDI